MKEHNRSTTLISSTVTANLNGPNNTVRLCALSMVSHATQIAAIVSELLQGNRSNLGVLDLNVLNASSDVIARVASVIVDDMIDLKSLLSSNSSDFPSGLLASFSEYNSNSLTVTAKGPTVP